VFDCNISNPTQSCITYTPFPSTTNDTVTITYCEIANPTNCLEQVFYIHVGCAAPVANQDIAWIHTNSVVINGQTTNTTTGYQGINIDVLANDFSCYQLTNPTIIPGLPIHGTATVNPATGEIEYTPNAGFSGVDTLTYQTCNNDATCDQCDATIVIIHVDPQPQPCTSFETNICVEPMQPETVCPTFCIDGPWQITSATANYFTGCVIQVVDDNCVTYTALPLQTGNDTITVIACSDAYPTMCDTAYIYVQIGNCTPTPPVCETWTTTLCTAPMVTNTICPVFCPAGNYTITSATNQTDIICNIVINNGCVQYTGFPTNADINDVVTIIGCANGVCDTAYAYITVSNNCNGTPNQAPVAVDDSGTSTNGNPVTINVLGNDYDPDGDPLTVSVQQPEHGTLTVNGGSITYTPNPGFNGTDTYTYTICDDATPPLCDQATVTITVTGNSTPPVAVDDSGTSDGGLAVTINVISNDYDLDGDAITVTSYTEPANGTIIVNGNQFTYTPNAGFNGTDSFTYQICDDDGNCDVATVTITVINNECDDTFDICAEPMTPVQITPSFCGAGPWTITSATTTFNCSIQLNSDSTVVTYTALPLMGSSQPIDEVVTIVACSTSSGVCDTLYYKINVELDCDDAGRIIPSNSTSADIQVLEQTLINNRDVRQAAIAAATTTLSLANVYPVPATNFVNVAFVSPNNTTTTLTITDLTGRVMTTNRVEAQQGINTVNINLNGYTAGMYMVTISTENAIATTRFIKQ